MSQTLQVLIVEDEPLIAMMIEDFVDMLGHAVAGPADSVRDALPLVEQGGFDVAILDVNLSDGPCWRVADALKARDIPFVIATGGHVEPPPPEHADAPQLAKPFTMDGVEKAIEHLASVRQG